MSFLLPAAAAKLLQSCLTLSDHIDGSPPGSPVPGILQARILDWVASSFCCLDIGIFIFQHFYSFNLFFYFSSFLLNFFQSLSIWSSLLNSACPNAYSNYWILYFYHFYSCFSTLLLLWFWVLSLYCKHLPLSFSGFIRLISSSLCIYFNYSSSGGLCCPSVMFLY